MGQVGRLGPSPNGMRAYSGQANRPSSIQTFIFSSRSSKNISQNGPAHRAGPVIPPLPKGVNSRLEKIQRDFLWGSGNLDRKIHVINWGIVYLSKVKGGLGICNLSMLNKALMGKWVWRFAVEESH